MWVFQIHHRDEFNKTALDHAERCSHENVVQLLQRLLEKDPQRTEHIGTSDGALDVLISSAFDGATAAEASSLSKNGRQDAIHSLKFTGDPRQFTYGEVCTEGFLELLILSTKDRHPPRRTSRFLDLGSGRGKAVLVAAHSKFFVHCVGVELLEPLHVMAVQARERLDSTIRQSIEFFQGNMLTFDVSEFDVVYLSCLTWNDDVLATLSGRLLYLSEGSRVLSLRKFDLPGFNLVSQGRCSMSWGVTGAYVFERKAGLH